MRLFSRIKVLVLVSVAFSVIGFSGCGPGTVVWKVDGASVPAACVQAEAGR